MIRSYTDNAPASPGRSRVGRRMNPRTAPVASGRTLLARRQTIWLRKTTAGLAACAAMLLLGAAAHRGILAGGAEASGVPEIDDATAGIACTATVPSMGLTGSPVHFQGAATHVCDTPGSLLQVDPIVGNLRCVPAGTFTQGSPAGEACRYSSEAQFTHTLTRAIAVMETEVTRQMWADLRTAQPLLLFSDVTDTTYSPDMACPVQNLMWRESLVFANVLSVQSGLTRGYYMDPNFATPLDGNNYLTGTVYCNWDAGGYRLPSEGEWEYFCRAGTTGAFSVDEPNYGSGNCLACPPTPYLNGLDTVAWWCGNASNRTHPAGQKTANPWNLRDVHGNVYEFCWDIYAAYPTGARSDYRGPEISSTTRTYRGGSFLAPGFNSRSAMRDNIDELDRHYAWGFRLVRTIPVTFDWNFGDGSPNSSQQSPTHQYSTDGTYHWSLTATASGQTCTKDGSIEISSSCIPPVITTHPQSQTIPSGQSANLSLTATGTVVSYRWYQGAAGDTSHLLTDGPSSTYTTAPLTTTTSFWVQAYNTCGTDNSDAATVTVTGGGPVITKIKSKTSKPGSSATIYITGHSTDKTELAVYFGNKKVKTISKVTSKYIKVTIPKVKKGTVAVHVKSNGVESNRFNFQIK
ncbi:MAG: SUMF1/EgtB/PvdO family nonheme iron enzyme [Acidobacteriota bacterium]